MQKICTHLNQIKDVTPQTEGCAECMEAGDEWLHLRMCTECGHVGCCDSSRNKHATRHWKETGHAIMKSLEPNEDWMWCFEDRVVM